MTNQISTTVLKTRQVQETTNYAMFNFLNGNRTPNEAHIKRLKESMKVNYLISPILVNEKLQIIDGQHRYKAAMELQLPIYYLIIEGYGLKEVQILNTNSANWKQEDYLDAYCDMKMPEYIKFRNFMRKFKDFGISASIIMATEYMNFGYTEKTLEGVKVKINTFSRGDFKMPNFDKSCEVADKLMMIKPYYNGFNRPTFIRAMIGCLKVEGFVFAEFLTKLKNAPTMLQHCNNVSQYRLLIEDIYNRRRTEKLSLRF
ncbi:MAG: ParB N-terminal domain-containing protein [Bacteroidota bacterium]